MDDVIVNKVATIERCLKRVDEEYGGQDRNLIDDMTKQDSIVLNLQRACEATIDLGMHLVRRLRLGVPQESRNAFELLEQAGVLDHELAENLQRMVGFRSIAVHDYQGLNLDIVRSLIRERPADLTRFGTLALTHAGDE